MFNTALSRTFCLPVILALVLSSCAKPVGRLSPGPLDIEMKNAGKVMPDIGVERSSQAMHHFLVGQLSYMGEDFERARKNFRVASDLASGPEPELHIKLAELYIQSTELEKALQELERALEAQPDNLRSVLLKGGVLEALERDAAAETEYLRVAKASPDALDAAMLLAGLYSRIGESSKALQVMESLLVNQPRQPVAWYFLAHLHEKEGQFVQAGNALSKAWEVDPANLEMAVDLLRLYLRAEDVPHAISVAEQILARDPGNPLVSALLQSLRSGNFQGRAEAENLAAHADAWGAGEARYKLALLDVQRQDARNALVNLSLALQQDPGHHQARYYLATLYGASGRTKEALSEIEKIPTDSSVYTQSRMLAAFMLRQKQDYSQAERVLRELLEEQEENSSALAYLILVLREAGKYESARQTLLEAIERRPADDKLLFQYAVVLHDLKLDEESMRSMEKVVELNPEHAEALNYIAYGLATSGGDLQRAGELVARALKVKPGDGYFLDTQGWILFKQNDFKGAEKILSRAVSASGEDLLVLEHYADCLISLKRLDKAVKTFNTAIQKGQRSESEDDKEVLKSVEQKLRSIIKSHPELKRYAPVWKTLESK